MATIVGAAFIGTLLTLVTISTRVHEACKKKVNLSDHKIKSLSHYCENLKSKSKTPLVEDNFKSNASRRNGSYLDLKSLSDIIKYIK